MKHPQWRRWLRRFCRWVSRKLLLGKETWLSNRILWAIGDLYRFSWNNVPWPDEEEVS